LPQTNVKGYRITAANQIELEIESTQAAASCPHCGKASERLHEIGDIQFICDLPIWNRRCLLHDRPRRFRCEACKGTFVEQVEWRRPGVSYTLRYETYVYQRCRREPIAQIAKDEGVSEETVQAIFVRQAKKR
jgi:transposase